MKCEYCQCQDFRPSKMAYMIEYNECVIVVRNVPCRECMQCGEKFVAPEAWSHLESMVESAKKLAQEVAILNYETVA